MMNFLFLIRRKLKTNLQYTLKYYFAHYKSIKFARYL